VNVSAYQDAVLAALALISAGVGAGATPSTPATTSAAAALPVGGGWSSPTPYVIPPGVRRLGVLVDYTGTGSNSRLAVRVRKGFVRAGDSSPTFGSEQVLDSGLASSGTTSQQGISDQVLTRPTSGAGLSRFALDVDVEGGWTHIAIELAEIGTPATPGTARVDVTGSL